MSRCSARLPIKCRDNQVSHERAISQRARSEESTWKRLSERLEICIRQKNVPDSDMERAMELGE